MLRDKIRMTKITVTDKNGTKQETEGQILNEKIYIYDKNVEIETGYTISYTSRNGLHKVCKVITPGYYGDLTIRNDFPIYQCSVRDVDFDEKKNEALFSIGTLNNYGNSQIGNNNIQNIETTFSYILGEIEKSVASVQEKTEAKNKLKLFLENPLINTLFGSICDTIISRIY